MLLASMTIKFYHYPVCPLSYKCRILFNILKLNIKIIDVNILLYKQISYKFFRLPVLIINENTPNELVIEGTLSILQYLKSITHNSIIEEMFISYKITEYEQWFDAHFYYNVYVPLVFQYTLGYYYNNNSILTTKPNDYYFNTIETNLTGSLFFNNSHITLTDITCFSYIAVLEYFGQMMWYKYPNIYNWYNRLKLDENFLNVLKNSVLSTYNPPDNYTQIL